MGGALKPALRNQRGESLIENALKTLCGVYEDALLIAPKEIFDRLEAQLGLSERAPSGGALMRVFDRGLGPARALAQALPQVQSSRLLLVGGDHPHPSAQLAQRLLLALDTEPAQGALVVWKGRPQPLFSAFDVEALRKLSPFPRALLGVVDALSIVSIPQEALSAQEQHALIDVDSLQEAQAEGLTPG